MSRARLRPLVAPTLMGATRVVLGAFWLHEGLFKYSAGFGRADILLVAGSVDSNPRVPGFFRWFSDHTLTHAPTLFGFTVPLTETMLGLALVTGVLTGVAALGSIVQLVSYWCADQLITQYPIMAILSVAVVLTPRAAARLSLTSFVLYRLRHRLPVQRLAASPVSAWL